ncbi:hypothetical protein F5Y09DRAFT_347893 [Xylaria sp. FL1042]|nr:hypothetical protein F5Y09DRAFT_347893 [Xylaria sp. FL1042]
MELAVLLAESIARTDVLHNLRKGQLTKFVHTNETEDISRAFKYLLEGWESRPQQGGNHDKSTCECRPIEPPGDFWDQAASTAAATALNANRGLYRALEFFEASLAGDLSTDEAAAKKLRDAQKQLEGIVDEARKQDGIDDFQYPPTKEKCEAAAQFGSIVVINVCPCRRDVITIKLNDLKVGTA